MSEDINVKQMKEFLEFRLDKVEGKVDAIPGMIEKLDKEYNENDKTQTETIQEIGSKVNLMYKVFAYISTAIGSAFTAHYFGWIK